MIYYGLNAFFGVMEPNSWVRREDTNEGNGCR